MPLPSLYVNGRDVEALGLRVSTVKGIRDVPSISNATLSILGRAGRMRTGVRPAIAARDILVTGQIFEATGARTHADWLAKLDTLKALFATGVLELRTVDVPARSLSALLSGNFDANPTGPEFVAVAGDFSLPLTCDDPFWYDVDMQSIAFGARTQIPLGTAPSGGIIRIMGPATNPVISYRDLAGTVLHSLTFTRTLASTDYEEIDLDNLTIARVQSGSSSNDIGALTSGDLEDFVLSPENGDAIAGAYPTLECSGLGSGGGCELLYWRAWL